MPDLRLVLRGTGEGQPLQLRFVPDTADAYYLQGRAAIPNDLRYRESLEWLNRALESDPGHTLALEARSRTFAELRDPFASLADAERLIAEGRVADLLVFDPSQVRDRATFEQPFALAEGFEDVLVGGVVGSWKLGRWNSVVVGLGMGPRGEVGIVVALIGLSSGVITTDIYSQVIMMSILTSLFAPSLLRKLLVPPAESPPSNSQQEPSTTNSSVRPT